MAAFALSILRGAEAPEGDGTPVAALAEGLRRAGLTALVLERLRGRSASPALLAALEKERDRLRADLALLHDRLGKLADCLGRAGVPFIALKGAALAPLLYDSPEQRPMVDLDILIRRSSWPAAREALGSAGYILPGAEDERYWLANYFNVGVSTPGDRPSPIDVHWSLSQEIRYRVDEEGLWSRAVPFRHEGRQLLRLGNEDLLLALILHIAYHYFDARLLWLYDIHLLCRKLPVRWETAVSRAAEWGMATIYGLGLAYVEKTFPGSIPSEALSASEEGAARRALLAPLRSPEPDRFFRGDDRRLIQLLQGILVMDRPTDMIRFGADKIARRVRFLGRRPRLR